MPGKYTRYNDEITLGGYTFPMQKLPENKKKESWYKKHLKYADRFLAYSGGVQDSRENVQENYDLRVNILDTHKYSRFIDPDGHGLDKFPAEFKHIGVGNAKINLLIGDYLTMDKDFKVVVSNHDSIGLETKSDELAAELKGRVEELINSDFEGAELEKRVKELEVYSNTFQSTGEKVMNAIITREFKEKNYELTVFPRTFEDLLLSGYSIASVDIYGKEPSIERLDPRNIITIGSSDSMFIHDQDIIVHIEYMSPGRVHDKFWDELSDINVSELERSSHIGEHAFNPHDGTAVEYPVLQSNTIDTDEPQLITVPEYRKNFGSTSYRNSKGELRVLTVFWKSRRKVLEVTKIEELTGDSYTEYHNEHYVVDEAMGETKKVLWINEWRRATQIAEGVYVKMEVVQHSARSLTNISYGLPPIVGVTTGTNSYRVQSLMDILKPFDIAYDIAFWKREIEIATYKGKATAINAAMIPSEFDPQTWLHYSHIDKIMLLNPHEEVSSGINEGKAAGIYNSFITQEVSLGSDSQSIAMLTDYLENIEYTMGKISGVHGAREGQVGERSAVRNNQLEVEQFTKITQKYFALDSEFRRIVLKKFSEVCKVAYAESPDRGMYLYSQLGQEWLEMSQDFALSNYDIHIANSQKDKQLLQELKEYGHAAMQNGQVQLHDVVKMTLTPSMSERVEILRRSSEEMLARQQQSEQAASEAQERMAQVAAEAENAKNQTAIEVALIQAGVKDKDSIRRLQAALHEPEVEAVEEDTSKMNIHNDKMSLDRDKLRETIRSNKAKESISKMQKTKKV